jgi:hypothetical protein
MSYFEEQRNGEARSEEERSEEEGSVWGGIHLNASQWTVIGLAVAFSVGAILYRLILHEHMGQSAAMFLGLPTVLAILLALTPKAETATGSIMKGMTLALLMIAPLVGEGYLCILFAAPLFYVVGLVIGLVVDFWGERRAERQEAARRQRLGCLAVLLLPMCLEGVIPGFEWERGQAVEVSRVVVAPVSEVQEAMAGGPRVGTTLPVFLKIGFPRPLGTAGGGLEVGAERTIHFAGAEGDPPGDLVMRVAERGPGYVRFETVSDKSKLTQWLDWEGSDVEWRAVDAVHTEVSWRIRYRRRLDPAWYFGPWERVAVKEAAKYLIAANATPEKVVAR